MATDILEIDPGFTFVEIGCSDSPVTVRGEYPFPQEHQYIGIDKNAESLERAQAATEREKPQINATFIEANAKQLPLSDDCTDEVFVGNVLGDPTVDFIRAISRTSNRRREIMDNAHPDATPPTIGSLITVDDFETIPVMLAEVNRILKSSGRLTIMETLTPLYDPLVKALLDQAGMSLEKQVNFSDEEWEAEIRPYYTFGATEAGVNTAFAEPVIYIARAD